MSENIEPKKKSNLVTNLIIVLCIIIFTASAGYLLKYYLSARKTQSEIDELQTMIDDSENSTVADNEVVTTKEGKTILKKYKKLYKKNSDIVGWIKVKNTPINYPVMQTKEDPEFYLHKNFKKKYDINGLPFLDAKCNIDDSFGNMMIYGHHMRSGMMFAHLVDYDSKDFYNKHKTFSFNTLYEERTYEVVAAFYSQIYKENQDVFKYYNWPGTLMKEDFDNYVTNVKNLSVYDTGVTPTYGEQLVTMVTCAYQTEEGRFVVVGKRIS